MKRTLAGLSLALAVGFAVLAALPAAAPATTGDRTVNLTLTCNGAYCSGGWGWYQGGTSGTQLGSGSISGSYNTTTATTVQPGTADTVIIDLSDSNSCGTSQTFSFTPGSAINFTVKLNVKPGGYNNFCKDSFNMKS